MLFKKKNKEDNLDSDLGSPLDLDNKNKEEDIFGDKSSGGNNDSNFSSGISDMNNSLDELHSKGFSQQSQGNASMNNTPNGIDNKDFQILNSKLDSIKSELDALSQHVLKIERDIDSSLQDKNNIKKKPMW